MAHAAALALADRRHPLRLAGRINLWLSIFLLVCWASDVNAATGRVVFNKSGCRDRFVVETPLGYSILEWYGGVDPPEGTAVAGDFESYGFVNIVNTGTRDTTRVWVEDYWLTKAHMIEKMRQFCR